MTITVAFLMTLLTLVHQPAAQNETQSQCRCSNFRWLCCARRLVIRWFGRTATWFRIRADADNGTWKTGEIPAKGKRFTVVEREGEQSFTCLHHRI